MSYYGGICVGLRYRKSIKLGGGAKLNIGRKSVGVSFGNKYGGVSFNSRTGSTGRVSAPGTGISYRTSLNGGASGGDGAGGGWPSGAAVSGGPPGGDGEKPPFYKRGWFIVLAAWIVSGLVSDAVPQLSFFFTFCGFVGGIVCAVWAIILSVKHESIRRQALYIAVCFAVCLSAAFHIPSSSPGAETRPAIEKEARELARPTAVPSPADAVPEAEAAPEPETLEEPEAAPELESMEEPEPAQEPDAVEEPEPAQEPEAVEEPEPVQEPEAIPEPEVIPAPAPKPEKKNNFDTYDIQEQQQTEARYVLNLSSKKVHHPSCPSVAKIKPEHYAVTNKTIAELEAEGFTRCGQKQEPHKWD